MKPKLSSSVSVVPISNEVLEFFQSNTRRQVRISVKNDMIEQVLTSFDGTLSLEEIASLHDVTLETLISLVEFLRTRGLLDNVSPSSDFDEYHRFRRVIHFLSDFSDSHESLQIMWNKIRTARVLIIGIGAVGSWVATNLIESGINHIALMDPDVVDISNLHRQFSYTESDIGRYKVDVLKQYLLTLNPEVSIDTYKKRLESHTLSVELIGSVDLIINCADKPNVDSTSLWVGEYCMEHNIPHIVGGGYNLHLSLVGQTVIPNKTACVKCFQKTLEEENVIDTTNIKKLAVKNRKVGSVGPMCSINASFIGMEAIKVISGCIFPSNANRRGEFDVIAMDIEYKDFQRREDCEWCGKTGFYNNRRSQ